MSLLAQTFVSIKYWVNAIQTQFFLINRMPTPILQNNSPFQVPFHQSIDYLLLRIFGSIC